MKFWDRVMNLCKCQDKVKRYVSWKFEHNRRSGYGTLKLSCWSRLICGMLPVNTLNLCAYASSHESFTRLNEDTVELPGCIKCSLYPLEHLPVVWRWINVSFFCTIWTLLRRCIFLPTVCNLSTGISKNTPGRISIIFTLKIEGTPGHILLEDGGDSKWFAVVSVKTKYTTWMHVVPKVLNRFTYLFSWVV